MIDINDFKNIEIFGEGTKDKETNDVRMREMDWLGAALPDDALCLEFGVFKGRTINRLSSALPDASIFGFDSFEGLPEDWDLGEKFTKKEAFDTGGVMPEVADNVTLIKGWFDKTIPVWKESGEHDSVDFVNVDCDLYVSAKVVLEELNDYIVEGTIIRFDELACWRSVFNERSKIQRVKYTTWEQHEWKALNEWLEKYDRKVKPLNRNWFQSAMVEVIK
jgi:hypothetical protein